MGSIPLAANNLKVPEQPNALEQYARIMQLQQQQKLMPGQLQQQQQQIQAGQQENQVRGQQIKDQQAMTSAMQEWDGKDMNQLPGLMLKHGASAQAVMSTKTGIIKQQQDLATLSKDQLANEKTKNDYFVQALDNVKQLPPEQQAQGFQSAVQDAVQKGHLDPQTAQGLQYQGPQQLDVLEKTLMGHNAVLEQALKGADAAKANAQAGEATANTTKLQAELNFYKKQGLAPGVPLDAQEAADWMQKNPGKGPADFMKMKAALVPQMNFNLNNGGSGPGTPAYQDNVNGVAGGKLKIQDVLTPRTPYSVRQQFLSDVMKANPAFKASDFDIEKGVAKSFTSGKVSDELNAYNTAIAHADLLKSAADAMNNGNIRALNSIGNQLGVQFGSDKKTNFDIIRNAYTAETTKALTSGHITDTELGKQGGTMPDNASPQQFAGAVNAYKALMASKKQQRIDQYNQGTQAKPNFGNQSQPSGSYTPPAGAKSAIGPNGHKIVVDGGKWVDAETGKPIQ